MHDIIQFSFSFYMDRNPNQGINGAIHNEQAFPFQLMQPT